MLLGPNGAGKSTLFKILTGKEEPDSGTVEVGDTVRLGYVDQSRDHLDPKNNVWEEISDGLDYMKVNGHDTSTRAYVGAFNFKGPDQQKKVGQLSGGERRRVHLARALIDPRAKAIILDEPFANVDIGHQPLIVRALQKRHAAGQTIICAVQQLHLVAELGGQVLGMSCGQPQVLGLANEVLTEENLEKTKPHLKTT